MLTPQGTTGNTACTDQLTRVQALCDGGGINEVTSTQLASDMLVDVTHSHSILTRKRA